MKQIATIALVAAIAAAQDNKSFIDFCLKQNNSKKDLFLSFEKGDNAEFKDKQLSIEGINSLFMRKEQTVSDDSFYVDALRGGHISYTVDLSQT